MANVFKARWGDEVEKYGYVMAPFYALQIGTDGSRLAVIACCYKFTWKGPEFDVNLAEVAKKMGIGASALHKQFVTLWQEGAIEMTAISGHKTHIDMSPLIEAVNALAVGALPTLVPRTEKRQKRPYRKRNVLYDITSGQGNLLQDITQSTVGHYGDEAQCRTGHFQCPVRHFDF